MKVFAVSFIVGIVSILDRAGATEPPVIGGLERPPVERIAGAVLVSELGCSACHGTAQAAFAAKVGPDLSAVGARVNGVHLRRFIVDPSGVKPGTTMPDVLAHLPETERDDAADALTHFLASLGRPIASGRPAAEAVERGRKLYHSVGCVACHSPEKALPDSVPLGPVAEKYTLAGLTAFLRDPLAARPSGRMPECHLDYGEAEDIASYLLREQQAPVEVFQPDAARAARGRTLFAQHRCDACHRVGEKVAPPALPALSEVRATEGCLSNQRGAWPHYPLSDAQRVAVRTALAEEAKVWEPAAMVQVTLTRLNCIACHQRDELGGVDTQRSEYFTGLEEGLGD